MAVSSSSLAITLFLTFFIPYCFVCGVTGKCHVYDEAGLLGFKSGITEDPMGILKSWIPGTDCCEWWGVECSDKRVTALMLSLPMENPKGYMSGTISPLLTRIRNLRTFWLQDLRNITGTFPRFLFNLPELSSLVIENSKLSGPLPADLGLRLPRVFTLDLPGNRFTGMIPNSVSKLTELIYLNLDRNLFVGNIPNGIGDLKNLSFLTLSQNRLSGRIPDVFSSMSSLWRLDLSHNKLSGNIPLTMSAMAPSLAFLQLGHNALTGEIPSFLGNFRALDTLDLSLNRFSGVVPRSFKNLTKIFNLDLSRNVLVDPFPSMNVRGIESLDLSYNGFKLGKIPKWVTSSTIIYSLKLAGCGLKMKLQDWKPTEPYYYDYIDLSNNQISGSPVKLLNRMDHIVGFWASGNKLKFNMSELIVPKTLKFLDMSQNQIFGKVPISISGMKRVNVSQNHLCGQIPKTKFPIDVFKGNDCLCGSPLPPCEVH